MPAVVRGVFAQLWLAHYLQPYLSQLALTPVVQYWTIVTCSIQGLSALDNSSEAAISTDHGGLGGRWNYID